MNLIYGGASLTLARTELSSANEEMLSIIERAGIEVITPECEAREFDIIMDCAAQFIHCVAKLGRVELTRSGAELYASRGGEAVYMADGGRIKLIETTIGTGESLFRALEAMGHSAWGRLMLLGCGKVGGGILREAVKRGIEVVVVSDERELSEWCREVSYKVIDYRDREAVEAEIDGCYLMVSATGQVGSVERTVSVERVSSSNILLANMGADDEFGESFARDRILAQGRSLNFTLDEPTQLRYIEATLSLHNYGAEYLLENPQARGVVMPSYEIEQRLLEITQREGEIGAEIGSIF
ncbi:MAG: NAD(P)-binding domain-containing protein [Rikenellaceae bacterium]